MCGLPIGEGFDAMRFRTLERTPTSFVAGRDGRVRIVFDFRARPAAAGSVLSTETRVAAADRRARLAFRLYWLVVGPFLCPDPPALAESGGDRGGESVR
jgi:hypothetical protein